MKKLFHSTLCLLAALHLMGGPLGMMQMVAWAEMLRDYTQEKGLIAGVASTFDGEHPCPKCCKIALAQKEEQKQNPLPQNKLEKLSKWFSLHSEQEVPDLKWKLATRHIGFTEPLTPSCERGIAPPTPPPRVAA